MVAIFLETYYDVACAMSREPSNLDGIRGRVSSTTRRIRGRYLQRVVVNQLSDYSLEYYRKPWLIFIPWFFYWLKNI